MERHLMRIEIENSCIHRISLENSDWLGYIFGMCLRLRRGKKWLEGNEEWVRRNEQRWFLCAALLTRSLMNESLHHLVFSFWIKIDSRGVTVRAPPYHLWAFFFHQLLCLPFFLFDPYSALGTSIATHQAALHISEPPIRYSAPSDFSLCGWWSSSQLLHFHIFSTCPLELWLQRRGKHQGHSIVLW